MDSVADSQSRQHGVGGLFEISRPLRFAEACSNSAYETAAWSGMDDGQKKTPALTVSRPPVAGHSPALNLLLDAFSELTLVQASIAALTKSNA
jgi:hypothetical protein